MADPVRFAIESVGLTYTDQFAQPLREPLSEKQYVGGVRSSKTTHECLEVLIRVPGWINRNVASKSDTDPEGRETLIWLIAREFLLTDQEFDLLVRWGKRTGLWLSNSEAQEGSKVMKWRGNITIETRASEKEEKLASKAPDFIMVCEAGQVSERARDNIRERALEKASPIVWGGTFEDGEGTPRWIWFEEQAQDWLENPTRRHKAYSLPTWENPLWSSCLPWLELDDTLADFCPDENHGTAHSFRNHPQIKVFELQSGGEDSYQWKRRIAAIPTGVQFAVYPQMDAQLLQPMNQMARLAIWTSAGGIDYGTTDNHPSALVVVQLTDDPRDREPYFVGPRGIGWVRECIVLRDGGDTTNLRAARSDLALRYRTHRWNVDPNERFMAKSFEGENTSYSESARLARHGLVRSRLNLHKLFFDLDGPGVPALVAEMKLVHYRKDKMGQFHPHRDKDDRTAALEDAIEALDGVKGIAVPPTIPMRLNRPAARKRPEFARRV